MSFLTIFPQEWLAFNFSLQYPSETDIKVMRITEMINN